MANDFVQLPVDGAGKKTQTFSNVIAAETVHSTASTPVKSDGTEIQLQALLEDIKRSVTDYRTLLDYDGRLDGNPVYVGVQLQATLVATSTWIIKKLFYDASSRLVDVQVLSGAWTGRAALAWKPAGGD